jgi:hypothetical protein
MYLFLFVSIGYFLFFLLFVRFVWFGGSAPVCAFGKEERGGCNLLANVATAEGSTPFTVVAFFPFIRRIFFYFLSLSFQSVPPPLRIPLSAGEVPVCSVGLGLAWSDRWMGMGLTDGWMPLAISQIAIAGDIL